MKKILRIVFCLMALAACFQMTGIESAFCDDSVAEEHCKDCLTCIGHQPVVGRCEAVSLPGISFSGYTFFDYSFRHVQHFPASPLRPPITR